MTLTARTVRAEPSTRAVRRERIEAKIGWFYGA